MTAEIVANAVPRFITRSKSANEGFRECREHSPFSFFSSSFTGVSLSLLIFVEGQIPSSGTIVSYSKARKYAGMPRRDNGNPRRACGSFPHIFFVPAHISTRQIVVFHVHTFLTDVRVRALRVHETP